MRIGTRRSALALAQAELVAEELRRVCPGVYELCPMDSGGDRDTAVGGEKSRWVDTLEWALIEGEIDLAVHSAKDVPGELAVGLELLGAPPRADPHDVLCGASTLEELPTGARLGTASVRRLAQLRAARDDIEVVPLRGNVDTRLRKLSDPGEGLDAIVLARAGLQRLGRDAECGGVLDARRIVPAPGQGTLALEGRSGEGTAREAAAAITDADTFACLRAERALAWELGASCHTPLGAHAVATGDGGLQMCAWVGLPDGSRWISDELCAVRSEPEELGRTVAARLAVVGAGEMLARAEEMAGAA